MTRRPRLTSLSGLSLSSLLLCCAGCAPESGQTGSPVSKVPDYETPERRAPERPGGGNTGEVPGEEVPNIVPRPAPKPGATALIGDTLVVAERGGLTLLDVSTPAAPRVLSRLQFDGEARLLRADALDRLVVGVSLVPHAPGTALPGSGPGIPEGIVPDRLQQVWAVDASQRESPWVVSKSDLPQQAAEIVVRTGGYTALGAITEAPAPVVCGGAGLVNIGLDLPGAAPAVLGLWLEAFGPDATGAGRRRELGPGHWQVATDQTHAIRIGLTAGETPLASFELELVDLSTLETTFQTRLTPAELGAPLSSVLSADYSEGLLVVAGGVRLLAFDTVAGSALPPLTNPGPIYGLRFLSSDELALEGGGALARVDRSGAAPSVALVPLGAGTPITGPLMPFGDGYLALDGTGGGPVPPLLRATSYALDASGALVLVDQLQTNWYFSTDWYNGLPWRLDSAGERLSYTLPVDDSQAGRTGLIVGTAGQLSASDLATTQQMSPGPLLHEDTLLGFGRGILQPIQIEAGATPHLSPLPAHTLALDDVWFEVQHAGLIWARHRTDTGISSVSVRPSEFAEPERLELPHAVDAILPVDANHVAVFGFSVEGMCEYWREAYPNSELGTECGPNAGNGVTVIAVDGGSPRIVRTIPLSSFIEGRPPAGIEQGIRWQGYLPVADGKWALWARFEQRCTSLETCAELGVPAYRSQGTRGGSCPGDGQECSGGGTFESISGYLNQSWLFVLDLTDPEAPALSPSVRAGAPFDYHGDEDYRPLGTRLLGYDAAAGPVWGYPVDEPIYNAEGNSEVDAQGQSMHRWYLQLMDAQGNAPRFDRKLNVPGEAVLLAAGTLAGGSSEHTAFTLEPRSTEGGEQSVWLNRVRIAGAAARVDQSLALGVGVLEARASGNLIAVLSGPADYCAADASYQLQVVDATSNTLALSLPLVLPGENYGWGFLSEQAPSGTLPVGGGPARAGGVLSVDLRSDPPAIVRYDY